MLWIILICICIIAAIFLFIHENEMIACFAAGGALLFLILFLAVPIKRYMEVESTHWYWSIDILTYQQVNKSDRTGHKSSRFSAERAAKENIPAEAYNIDIDTHSGSETVVDREWKDEQGRTHKDTHTEHYYYATYTYTINQWVKTGELLSCGNDKSPYEKERPFDTTAPNVLGNHKCGVGHHEEYKVTGYVNEEIVTYNISKSDWKQIKDTDEFSYKKYRFGHRIWDLKFAE